MGKLIGLLILIAAAYFLFFRKSGTGRVGRIERAAKRATDAVMRRRGGALDMKACEKCGEYVPESAVPCQRPDCPLTGAGARSRP